MKSNRLINEKSPYLLQHAHNPVNWWPWCAEAFDQARRLDKPLFVSIGYSTCHWCHVMEQESFQDLQAASVLNQAFICVKVDREERPDVDAVFMAACQVLGGNCGWPLTIVMTPDKRPFFAATYLPRTNTFGRPGLIEISRKIASLWQDQRQMVNNTADQVARVLASSFSFAGISGKLQPDILEQAGKFLEESYDADRGGFNGAPKFPMPHRLIFLMRRAARTGNRKWMQMATATLGAMRRGGIWDHVGYGFHRYSTDANWIVPHFEKMLYDQALLAMAYLEAFQITGDQEWAGTAREIFTYLADKLSHRQAGFFAAQDADTQGEEGRFYLWDLDQFLSVADDSQPIAWQDIFNLRREGNINQQASGGSNGLNVLYLSRTWKQWASSIQMEEKQLTEKWEVLRGRLYLEREKRTAPLTDDKILTDWNGLVIAALAMAARILGIRQYLAEAVNTVDFIFEKLVTGDGLLKHSFCKNHAADYGLASDYAYFIAGLLELYRTTLDAEYLEKVLDLQAKMDDLFYDSEQGGYYLAPRDSNELPVLPKDLYDGAMPSVNSVALNNLVVLERLTGDPGFRQKSNALTQAFGGEVQRQPVSFTHFLNGLELAWQPAVRVLILASGFDRQVESILEKLNRIHAPGLAVILKTPENASFLEKVAPFTAEFDQEKDGASVYMLSNGDSRPLTGDIEDIRRCLEPVLSVPDSG